MHLYSMWLCSMCAVSWATDYCQLEPEPQFQHFLCEEENISEESDCSKGRIPYLIEDAEQDSTLHVLNQFRNDVAMGNHTFASGKKGPAGTNSYQMKRNKAIEDAALNIVKYCKFNDKFLKIGANKINDYEVGLLYDTAETKDDTMTLSLYIEQLLYEKQQIPSIESRYLMALVPEMYYAGCAMSKWQKDTEEIKYITACAFAGNFSSSIKNIPLYTMGEERCSCSYDEWCVPAMGPYPGLCHKAIVDPLGTTEKPETATVGTTEKPETTAVEHPSVASSSTTRRKGDLERRLKPVLAKPVETPVMVEDYQPIEAGSCSYSLSPLLLLSGFLLIY